MWDFFTEDELRCKGTDECNMDEEFMEMLVALRYAYDKSMVYLLDIGTVHIIRL